MPAEVHVNDRELLRRTRAGEPDAFGTFYREHRAAVLGFLRVRVRSAEVAADLMCETFTQALVAVHDSEHELPVVPIAWLLTIARNLLIDSSRRGRVEDSTRQRLAMQPLELSDRDLDAIDQAASEADVLQLLHDALPADQAQAFRARVLDDREYAEIARELKTSESVVRKKVSRARQQLRSLRLEGRDELST
jgi:RNA polymerase sigma factor (sigma-70 family)